MATPRERHDPWHTDLTYIIGHQRPDMDAIASAMGYAWFLGQTGDDEVVAARAGQVGAQAAFALGYFGTRPPRVLSSAAPTFGHVASPQEPVTPDAPLGEAMSRLAEGRAAGAGRGRGRQAARRPDAAGPGARLRPGGGGPARASEQTCRAYVEELPTVPAGDRIRDRRGTMLRGGGEEFLVVGEDGRYVGTASRQCLLEPPRARLILVDHNELSQAVTGRGRGGDRRRAGPSPAGQCLHGLPRSPSSSSRSAAPARWSPKPAARSTSPRPPTSPGCCCPASCPTPSSSAPRP